MNESWSVTYTWHDAEQVWHVATEVIDAENIGIALHTVDEYLADKMERKGWSDYWVTSISVIPEMH